MDPEYTGKLLSTVSAAANSAAQDPLVSLHAVYDAIIKGDFEAIGEFMADDVAPSCAANSREAFRHSPRNACHTLPFRNNAGRERLLKEGALISLIRAETDPGAEGAAPGQEKLDLASRSTRLHRSEADHERRCMSTKMRHRA
jgi:hypothetical protein